MAVPPMIPFNDIPPLDEFHLSSGYPGFVLIEKSALAFDKASSDCMSNPQLWMKLMQYGPENGAETFRKTLANFLSKQYQSEVIPDELFITTGASFGVTLVSTALFEAGDMAFVADPTYFLVFDILKMGKLNLTCVSIDEHGIIPAALEEAIVQQTTKHGTRPLTENKPYRGLIYGGFYVWVTLPEDTSAQAILDEYLKHKMNFHVGNKFSMDGNFKNCFRISFSYYNIDTLQLAARKLVTVIQNQLQHT